MLIERTHADRTTPILNGHHTAVELKEAMAGIDGLVDLHVELHEPIPQIQVKVDLDRAQRYGLKPGDVRRAAGRIVAGQEIGDIHTANRTYDVQLWSIPEARHSLTSLQNLPINVQGGGIVTLSEIADVRVAPTPNTIEREHLKRKIDVSANVKGRDLGSVYLRGESPFRCRGIRAALQMVV